MVKINFLKHSIQLWPEEFVGKIEISDSSVRFMTPNSQTKVIYVPVSWTEDKAPSLYPTSNPHDLSLLLVWNELQPDGTPQRKRRVKHDDSQHKGPKVIAQSPQRNLSLATSNSNEIMKLHDIVSKLQEDVMALKETDVENICSTWKSEGLEIQKLKGQINSLDQLNIGHSNQLTAFSNILKELSTKCCNSETEVSLLSEKLNMIDYNLQTTQETLRNKLSISDLEEKALSRIEEVACSIAKLKKEHQNDMDITMEEEDKIKEHILKCIEKIRILEQRMSLITNRVD